MPRKVGAGGHAPIRPPQEPPPRPAPAPPPADVPSSSVQQPRLNSRSGARSIRMMKEKNAVDRGKAIEKNQEFTLYAAQLHMLSAKFGPLLKKLDKQRQEAARRVQEAPPASPARAQAREKEKALINKYHEILAMATVPLAGADSKCLVDHFYAKLDKFDATPERVTYCREYSELKETMDNAKSVLACVVSDCEVAKSHISESANRDLRGRQDELTENYIVLAQEVRKAGGVKVAFHLIEPLIVKLAELNKDMGDLRANGLAQMKVTTAMLSRSEVQRDVLLRTNFTDIHQAANYNNAGLSFMMARNLEMSVQILLELTVGSARDRQHGDRLKNWADGVMALCNEHRMVTAADAELMAKEKSVLRSEYRPTIEEERVWTTAAADIPERYEQISASLRRCADTYTTLQPTAAHELGTLIAEMATCIADAASSRLQSAQSGAERVRKAEADSLPARLLPPQRQPEPGPQLLRTRDGVVLGLVKEEGKLDAVSTNNRVAASYFLDEGEWVRDYGDEVAVAPTARATVKANNIAAASDRSVARLREEIKGVTNTEQVGLLQRAYASKARAIVQIAGTKADANPGEAAMFDGLLTRLKADKQALGLEIKQARDILMMRHDPNPAAFLQLWESGRVASIEQTKQRQANRSDDTDLLDRYVISFKDVRGEKPFKPWVVHAHYGSAEKKAEPQRVHMKRFDEKDWGRDRGAYHSAPLNTETFEVIRREIVRQEVAKLRAARA